MFFTNLPIGKKLVIAFAAVLLAIREKTDERIAS